LATLNTGTPLMVLPSGRAAVRVAVEHRVHRVAQQGLLQPAAAQEREDLRRLAAMVPTIGE
jgi:hypothetical protein